jgi:hypothetical protein
MSTPTLTEPFTMLITKILENQEISTKIQRLKSQREKERVLIRRLNTLANTTNQVITDSSSKPQTRVV